MVFARAELLVLISNGESNRSHAAPGHAVRDGSGAAAVEACIEVSKLPPVWSAVCRSGGSGVIMLVFDGDEARKAAGADEVSTDDAHASCRISKKGSILCLRGPEDGGPSAFAMGGGGSSYRHA